MKLLLDTHVVLWQARQSSRLSQTARAALADLSHDRLISTVSLWEMGIKRMKGKLPEAGPLLEDTPRLIQGLQAEVMPVGLDEVLLAPKLVWDHADPFDRMLAAQAIISHATLVTCDPQFEGVDGLDILW